MPFPWLGGLAGGQSCPSHLAIELCQHFGRGCPSRPSATGFLNHSNFKTFRLQFSASTEIEKDCYGSYSWFKMQQGKQQRAFFLCLRVTAVPWVQFKVLVLIFKGFHGIRPDYLRDCLSPIPHPSLFGTFSRVGGLQFPSVKCCHRFVLLAVFSSAF